MQKGVALLLIVVALGITLVFVLLISIESGLSHQSVVSRQSLASELKAELDACLEEVIIHTQKDLDYSDDTVFNGSRTCDVIFTLIGDQTTVVVSITENNQTLKKTAVIELDPFALISVE